MRYHTWYFAPVQDMVQRYLYKISYYNKIYHVRMNTFDILSNTMLNLFAKSGADGEGSL